jgi:hypothetical protein
MVAVAVDVLKMRDNRRGDSLWMRGSSQPHRLARNLYIPSRQVSHHIWGNGLLHGAAQSTKIVASAQCRRQHEACVRKVTRRSIPGLTWLSGIPDGGADGGPDGKLVRGITQTGKRKSFDEQGSEQSAIPKLADIHR